MIQLGTIISSLASMLSGPAGGSRATYSPYTITTRLRRNSRKVICPSCMMLNFRNGLASCFQSTRMPAFIGLPGWLNFYIVFRTGSKVGDVTVYKWLINADGQLVYDNDRAANEYLSTAFRLSLPSDQPTPSDVRHGDNPHVSIQDRFVECGQHLTIRSRTIQPRGTAFIRNRWRINKLDDADSVRYSGRVDPDQNIPYREGHPVFYFNEKLQSVHRVDSIGQSCILLPKSMAIFPDGYLQSGSEALRGRRRRNVAGTDRDRRTEKIICTSFSIVCPACMPRCPIG